MKKSEFITLVFAFTGLIFAICSFFFGGLETLTSTLTINQAFGALVVLVGVILFLFIRKMIASVKWWKASDTWCKDVKVGDTAYLSTHDVHEDVEIVDVDDEQFTVKLKVHKSRIYKPYN